MYHTLEVLFIFSLISLVIAKTNLISPCPRLFEYETDTKESDAWYGTVTMISDFHTHGNLVEIQLDKPAVQFNNWYGLEYTEDRKKYLIYNVIDDLKPNMKRMMRIFVKYDTKYPPPRLIGIFHNTKKVCPEENVTETTTTSVPPKTSIPLNLNEPTQGGNEQKSEDENFFMGDLYNLFNRPSKADTEKSTTDDICGTIVIPPKPLITHGQQTNERENPWHVAIYHARGASWLYVCGASLISKDFVITAGHCVTRPRSSTTLKPENLNVYLGKHYLKNFSNKGIQDRQISEIIVHPQYSGHNFSNDIALLRLSRPAEYTDYVRPICLWQESIDLESIINKYGKVVGWGFDETGNLTDQLIQAEMPVVSVATCLYSLPQFFSRFTSENTFCAGFRNGTSVCNGDSGGGLVFLKSNSSSSNPVWQLRGLVSISAAAQINFKCNSAHFAVYTDTAKYLTWIRDQMN